MTLGDTPKISFSQKCRKSLRIYNYGFCFRKWRSMTLPNGPGFCFQKWRSVRYPDFWLFSTLTFNIVTWWRHTCDVTSCTYTLTDTLSATYDVTVLSPCVTSQVTKIYFWILFPWMTLGENPKMLPIWVNGIFNYDYPQQLRSHGARKNREVPASIDINTESIVLSINTKIMFNYNRTCTP